MIMLNYIKFKNTFEPMKDENPTRNPRSRSIYLKNLASYETKKDAMIQKAKEIEYFLLCWEDMVYTDYDHDTIEYLRETKCKFENLHPHIVNDNEEYELGEDLGEDKNYFDNKKEDLHNLSNNFEEKEHKNLKRDDKKAKNMVFNNLRMVELNRNQFYARNISNIVFDMTDSATDKVRIGRFSCRKYNCNKTYTSSYGLEYHEKHGHKVDLNPSKVYRCFYSNCSKRYKNPNGLQYHIRKNHQ